VGFAVKAPVAIGYRDRRYGLLALGAMGPRRWFKPPAGLYHAHAYYELLGGRIEDLAKNPIHPADLLGEWRTPARGGIVLAPGGAKNLLRDDALRRYPIKHYVELARRALDLGRSVTLMGSASDEWIRTYFSGLPVRFEIGTVKLEDIPLWLRQFERLVTHDSGPMHLGFMSGIPVTALFGPTRADEKVPRNYADNGSIVIQGGQGLACAPCYDGRDYADCSHQKCLKDLIPSPAFLG
jgi:heptosyltransferase-2